LPCLLCGSALNNEGVTTHPAGLAISNAGAIYDTVATAGGDEYDGFFKLDTNSLVMASRLSSLPTQKASSWPSISP
jgi:hypothetical protein